MEIESLESCNIINELSYMIQYGDSKGREYVFSASVSSIFDEVTIEYYGVNADSNFIIDRVMRCTINFTKEFTEYISSDHKVTYVIVTSKLLNIIKSNSITLDGIIFISPKVYDILHKYNTIEVSRFIM